MSEGSIAVRCISHIGITVSDLRASVDFYRRLLGFTPCYEDTGEGWTRVGLALDDAIIELFSPFPASPPGEVLNPFYPGGYGRPKIALTVSDAAEAHAQLTESGITPLCPLTTTSASRFFFITDPDGTWIQLQDFVGGRARLAEVMSARGVPLPADAPLIE